jgi:hypothetical protein
MRLARFVFEVDGEIVVESDSAHGTAFRIFLAIVNPAPIVETRD